MTAASNDSCVREPTTRSMPGTAASSAEAVDDPTRPLPPSSTTRFWPVTTGEDGADVETEGVSEAHCAARPRRCLGCGAPRRAAAWPWLAMADCI